MSKREEKKESPLGHFMDRMMKSSEEKVRQATESMMGNCCVESFRKDSRLEVLWSGHLFDYSGYAKANRELLFRVANTFQIEIAQGDLEKELLYVDGYTASRLNVHKNVRVSKRAPFIRFYTPRPETAHKDRFRICYTMMETEKVHPGMIELMNLHYEEIWTPTLWNQSVFNGSGLKTPCYVMPLGVNPQLYFPMVKRPAPESLLLTTKDAMKREVPKGYLFCALFHPTFRKGTDILLQAFERAFGNDPEAALVLITTVHQAKIDPNYFNFLAQGPASGRARVYHCTGGRSEEDLPLLYSAFDSYVSPSRGEGWDLPAMEAAACGLFLIHSKCSSHTELFMDSWTSTFDPEGYRPYPGSEKICKWYEGMPFAYFGEQSINDLAEQLVLTKKHAEPRRKCAFSFSNRVRRLYSWNEASERIVRRLTEIISHQE